MARRRQASWRVAGALGASATINHIVDVTGMETISVLLNATKNAKVTIRVLGTDGTTMAWDTINKNYPTGGLNMSDQAHVLGLSKVVLVVENLTAEAGTYTLDYFMGA